MALLRSPSNGIRTPLEYEAENQHSVVELFVEHQTLYPFRFYGNIH